MNYEQMNNNRVFLSGTIISEPVYSHEVYGEVFYEISLSVKRLSEYSDIIPITISEKLLNKEKFKIGNDISIKGQFRSYNKIVDEKSRLMLTVFVREIVEGISENPNIIEITGYICKQPIYRMTPFKREICDVLVAVNRAYNKSDYLPCIAWGRNARYIKDFEIGKKVYIVGRIQSREYQKKINEEDSVTKVAYEISVSKINSFEETENGEIIGNVDSEII